MAIIKHGDKVKASERSIQNALYRYVNNKTHQNITPNLYIYDWESDMVSTTKAGYLHEYEIKISRSDFKADFKKVEKHQILKNGYYEPSESIKQMIDYYDSVGRNNLTPEGFLMGARPNYFWYVCSENLINVDDVPDYAGLMYVTEFDGIDYRIPKKAPLLHKEKITQKITQKINNTFMYKYWNLRLKK